TPASTPRPATWWTRWPATPRPRAPPSSSPRTSSIGPLRWPAGSSPSPAAGCCPSRRGSRCMWHDAVLVAGKDLRIEARSRVATNQVAPFAVLVLMLFAFALDPDRGVLRRVSAGLFWVAVLFSGVLAIQRSFAVETDDGGNDALRLSGLDPAGIFL